MTLPVQYEFICRGMPADTFAVNRLQGEEGLSQLYRFEIELRSHNAEVNFDTLLSQSCRLSIWVNGEERRIHGILSDCEMLRQIGDFALYRAVLVPRLWQLGLYHSNEVFLDKTVPDVLKLVLEEGGFTALDYELNLERNYRSWPYRCQYSESLLDFFQRLLEREGMYYFFEQGADGEKLVIVDHLQFHEAIPKPVLVYDPVSGLEGQQFGNSLQSLVCRQKRVARSVLLRDYNDEKPSVDIKGQAEVDAAGMGDVNVFGLNILSPEEGRELAEIRAEQIRSTKQVFHGESTVGRLAPGYTFSLERHFRSGFNQPYLVIAISHSGMDPTILSLGSSSATGATGESYKNSFSAISADVQYRPDPIAQRPQIHGNLDAVIDAEGDGQYAEVDAEGRYKVILPFDRQLRGEGKASHWIRMSQTFAGEREGMHFPLRKGTHVLLSFIGGDPDRPVITGAMPNASQPSVVTSDNQTKSKIQTRAGNFIEMEDREDSKRIKLYSPHQNTYMHLGAHNAPGDGLVIVSNGMNRTEIGGGSQHTRVSKAAFTSLQSEKPTAVRSGVTDQLFNEQTIYQFKIRGNDGVASGPMSDSDELSGNYHIDRRLGNHYIYTEGNEFVFGGDGSTFEFGSSYSECHVNETALDTASPEESFDMPATIAGAIGYNPDNSLVSKSWGDTLEYNNGNVYSWGDGCEYSFGGGYAESHIPMTGNGPTSPLNKSDWPRDRCPPPPHGDGTAINGETVKLNTSTAGVEKSFGNGYAYSNGNSLEVSVGDSESHSYGNSYEYAYRANGTLLSKSEMTDGDTKEWTYTKQGKLICKSENSDGTSKEWLYHPNDGTSLLSYTESAQNGTASFETKLMPTISMSIDLSTLSMSTALSVNEFSIESKANAVSMNLNLCQMEFQFQPFKIVVENADYEVKLPGVDVNSKVTELKTKMADIETKMLATDATQITAQQGVINLQTALLTMLS